MEKVAVAAGGAAASAVVLVVSSEATASLVDDSSEGDWLVAADGESFSIGKSIAVMGVVGRGGGCWVLVR